MSSTLTIPGKTPKKHTNFTQEQIENYLVEFRKMVEDKCYTIAKNENRKENTDFISDYKITSVKEREILLSIEATDFCYAVDNEKAGFEHEMLYVFCKPFDLDYYGEVETVEIYIKTNATQTKSGKNFMYVISFHPRNNPMTYLFK